MENTNKNNKKPRKRGVFYIDKKELLEETLDSLEKGIMSDKLARMVMLLVAKYATKGNWATYTYNDDMQAFALMAHMRSWRKFNPERSKDAFSFFTQCTKNSFKQFLNKEKRQRNIRDKLCVSYGLEPSHTYAATYQLKSVLEDEEKTIVDDEENYNNHELEYTKEEKDILNS